MYAPNSTEFPAREESILILAGLRINHILVRLHVPVVVIFKLYRRFVKHLRRAEVIFATESAQKQLCRRLGGLHVGFDGLWCVGSVFCSSQSAILPRYIVTNMFDYLSTQVHMKDYIYWMENLRKRKHTPHLLGDGERFGHEEREEKKKNNSNHWGIKSI